MNLIRCRITITITILLTIKEICSQTPGQDTKEMSNRFANLLNSLVKVNRDRVDTLKNLIKLYDVRGIKHSLRYIQNAKDNLEPEVFDGQDDYHKLFNTLTGLFRDNKRLCFCHGTEFNSDEKLHGSSKEQDVIRGIGQSYGRPPFHNGRTNEADQILILNINSKRQSHKKNDSTSLVSSPPQKLSSKPTKMSKSHSHEYWKCIRPKDAYVDCRYTCHDSYKIVCAKYGCMPALRKLFRKTCKEACIYIFKEPYE